MAKFYVKDRSIKIYQLISSRDSEGFELVTRRFIHPIDKYIKAYFKTLKSSEIAVNKQSKDDTEAYFIIGRRNILKDMYIDYMDRRTFGTETYQVTGVDPYDDRGYDIKVSVKKVNSPQYENEEGTNW